MIRYPAYQICVRCVMDTTHVETTFDENGVCNFCHAYEVTQRAMPSRDEAHRQLEQIIDRVKAAGRDREYDCILGVSGGVDSSYLACKLKELGLRTLAVQFDNGWNSELAVRNIELLCKKLDMDLYTYVVNWEEFRDLQVAFLRASVANVEAPSDHAIFATLFRVADEHGIRYIMNGNNVATEQISVPVSYGYDYRDLKQIHGIHARFGHIRLKTYPEMSLVKSLYYQRLRNIRSISLLNYMPYSRREAVELLEREIGWRDYGGKHHESIITRFHQSYILIEKFKVDKRRAHLSNMIYSGEMTRTEALHELQKPPCAPTVLEEDREYVAKKLGLTDKEFDQLIAAPPKSYRDYPNEEWLFKFYNQTMARRHQALKALGLRK